MFIKAKIKHITLKKQKLVIYATNITLELPFDMICKTEIHFLNCGLSFN